MRHLIFPSGKRLRPALAMAAAEAVGAPAEAALPMAAAVELIHTYSLIHDDLPCMDDDVLRRGRPTVHIEFGEDVAVLAGDALQSLAFEVLAAYPEGEASANRRQAAVLAVARAVGIGGMVGGQIADLEAEGRTVDAPRLDWIHRHKTGALIAASAELGAIHAAAADVPRQALGRYGEAVGLAFQVTDDLLDDSSTARELGKTPGKDRRSGKATYPAIHGAEASRAQAKSMVADALGALDAVGLSTAPLVALAEYSIARSR
jgi:geranylgeranyl pyrophosphate synthase